MNQPNTPAPDTALAGPTKPKRVKRAYGEQDKERGLIELALAAGNYHLAGERTGIPAKTLHNWANISETDRYERITNDVVPQVHARLAAQTEAAAAHALAVQEIALRQTEAQLQAGDIKDASTAARNMATVAGIMSDKANLYRGRPTSIVEHRQPDEILNGLATRIHNLTGQTINGSATELDSDPEPDSPVPLAQIAS